MTKTEHENLRILEAVLFATAEPLSEKQLGSRFPEGIDLKGMLLAIQTYYKGRGVELVRRGKSWCFRTANDIRPLLEKEVHVPRKLSRAAIEILAIVAYHQPVTRAEIEEVRGVSLSKGTLDVLIEAGWVKPGKRRETPGRPVTWKTTDDFLDYFGLEDVRDLPGIKELKASGLLESGPAISTYSAYGVERETNEEETSEAVALLSETLRQETVDETTEPLDPEGG